MITAHSGCNGTKMNSMAYLEYAVGIPVDALEIDIRRAASGRLVLGHDPAEDGALALEAAFRFLSDKTIDINCDLKHAGLASDVLDCAAQCGVAVRRIIFTGVIPERPVRQAGARVFVNAEELIPGFDVPPMRPQRIEALIARCREAGYAVVNLDHRLCDAQLIRACREAGIGLSVWTVDDLEAIRAFKAMGVVNITTNLAAEACF